MSHVKSSHKSINAKVLKPSIAGSGSKINIEALKKKLAHGKGSTEKNTVIKEKTNEKDDEKLEKEKKFEDFGLKDDILEALNTLHFTKPTPIQEQSLPYSLNGRDIIGIAQTGSGKTAAYVIPILQALWDAQTPYFACVLAPTRELAYQIRETFDALGSNMGLRCVTIVGGMDMIDQAKELMRKPHVIVATPGRLMDHLENTKGFSLRALKYLVMDEADRLLDMEFGDVLDRIFEILPRERHTYLFFCYLNVEGGKIAESISQESSKGGGEQQILNS